MLLSEFLKGLKGSKYLQTKDAGFSPEVRHKTMWKCETKDQYQRASISKARELIGKHGSWGGFKKALNKYLGVVEGTEVSKEWQYAFKRAGGWSHEDTVRQLNLPKDFKLTRDVLPEMNFQGLKIAIEQQPGTIRSGTREDGTPWETKFFYPYGFIKGTKGADGEEIDCFVGPNPNSPRVFIIHQRNSAGYDEDKVMLGFDTEENARDAYLAHFDTQQHLGPVSEMTVEEYRVFLGGQ